MALFDYGCHPPKPDSQSAQASLPVRPGRTPLMVVLSEYNDGIY